MHVHSRALALGAALLAGGAALALGTGVALASTGGGATGTPAPPPTTARVTICHATGSTSAPYVVATPSELAVLSDKYVPRSPGDIIPPFAVHGQSYPGHNWDSTGQAILKAGCVVTPTTTPPPPPPTTARVTICHATGSTSAPYVVATPSELAVLSDKYVPRSPGDIIPPFAVHGQSYPGHNWDSTGQAILKAGCVVTPTTSVSVVSNHSESAGAAEVVPTGSTHAGEYDGAWTGGQRSGAALALAGAATTAGALLRQRLGHRG